MDGFLNQIPKRLKWYWEDVLGQRKCDELINIYYMGYEISICSSETIITVLNSRTTLGIQPTHFAQQYETMQLVKNSLFTKRVYKNRNI